MALTDENNGGVGTTMLVSPTGNNGGFGGFGGDWSALLIIFLLCMFGGGWGMGGFGGGMMWPLMMGGGFGGGFGLDYLYPWLNNSQHISDGFRDQFLNTQIGDLQTDVNRGFGDVQLGIAGINQNLCQTGNNVVNAVNGAQNAISNQLYSNEIANLNRSFAEQQANTAGFTAVNSGIADTRYTIATEACATRTTDTQNTQNILTALTAGVQSIKDQMCQDKIDAKNDEISALRQQIAMKDLAASQTAQNAFISQGFANEVDALYNRLSQCPVNTVPVAGNTPLFRCNPGFNNNNGCGCGCGNANF